MTAFRCSGERIVMSAPAQNLSLRMYHAHRYNTSEVEAAPRILRISLWPYAVLRAHCVELFGFHRRGHRGHRERKE
jgi:hypothetical protein